MSRKLALIIGNNNYTVKPLKNCVNDATQLATALEKVDYVVTLKENLSADVMYEYIKDFIKSIRSNDSIVFFFAGHAVQWGDKNFLFPCDNNKIESGPDIQRYAINAQQTVDLMAEKDPHVILFLLDCCREYWMSRGSGARGDGEPIGGLQPMKPPPQTLIAFACAAGQTVADQFSNFSNSVFTQCLLKHITSPGMEIETMLRKVASDVTTATKNTQRPFRVSSITKENICLVPSSITNSMPQQSYQSRISSSRESIKHIDTVSRSGKFDTASILVPNATDRRLIDCLLGCAYGQALGDAYGLSTELEERGDVAYQYPDHSRVIPFPDYVSTGHNRRWARGDWSDDTDQWILIVITLMFHDGSEKVFAQKLTDWTRNGFPELGDQGGMELEATVAQIVSSRNYTDNPLRASEEVWERSNRQSASNKAVMRCSASAFVHFGNREKIISTTELMCKTTHFDPRCIASCLAVCLTINYLLTEDIADSHIEALIRRVQKETIQILGDRFSREDVAQFEWYTNRRTLEELNLDEPRKISYTYKSLASGFYGLRSKDSFEKTLNNLIRYGGDASTNGAVCGTMYGARHGYQALPSEWLCEMPNQKWFDQILTKCLRELNLIE